MLDPHLLAAAMAADTDALKATTALRRQFPAATPEQVSAALTQARLRHRAANRLGPESERLMLTAEGLEQATRRPVATARAARLARSAKVVADLGCGIGTESWAMARAGMRVIAVERDEYTAEIARFNARALELDITVITGDITDHGVLDPVLSQVDAVFLDPARREPHAARTTNGLQQGRLLDPQQWSPNWTFVTALAQRIPTVCKVAPGIDRTLISDAEVVFTSHDGDLVEAAVWFAPLGQPGNRQAVVMRQGLSMSLASNAPRTSVEISKPRTFILDPDDALIRADVLHIVAERHGALLDPHIAWITTDKAPEPGQLWLGTWYRVLDSLAFNIKELRWRLAALGITNVTIIKRGFAGDIEDIRKQLKVSGSGRHAALMLTRTDDGPLAVIAEQVSQ